MSRAISDVYLGKSAFWFACGLFFALGLIATWVAFRNDLPRSSQSLFAGLLAVYILFGWLLIA
jgi:hypothetical protein